MSTIATIGYEGRAQHDVLRLLSEARVELLVDVRIRAQSRKPGLSKTSLAAGLGEAGIDYLHLRDLGTPLEIRAEYRAKDPAAKDHYCAYLREDDAAQVALTELARLVGERRVAILCFEHDPRTCHRMVIVEELAHLHGIDVEHLGAPAVA